MIVWGGFPGLDSGGRYDPAADSWTATSTTNAPDGRFYHTAVWTGNEMIIWGGAYFDPRPLPLSHSTRVVGTIRAPILGQPLTSPVRPMPDTLTQRSGPAMK